MRLRRLRYGALVILALAAASAEAQQRKNRPNGNRPPGPGGPPPIGQVLPPFLLDQLKVTAEQRTQIESLQKEVDEKLATILTDEQKQALQAIRERGPGGFGPPPGGPPGDGFGGPPGGGPDGRGFGGPPGGGRPRSPVSEIMARLGSPRGSLTQRVGQELKQSRPPWEKIQGQTREYAQQAADLARYDPPRGSKESWATLTAEFAGSATALDRAAQAKDKKAAVTAQTRLAGSCMTCHRAHRPMGPGPGGGPPGGP